MKSLLSTLILFLLTISVIAQAPQAFKYQAVVRDNTGEVMANKSVSFRISIHEGSATGTIVYQETDTTTTNQFV